MKEILEKTLKDIHVMYYHLKNHHLESQYRDGIDTWESVKWHLPCVPLEVKKQGRQITKLTLSKEEAINLMYIILSRMRNEAEEQLLDLKEE